MREGIEEPDASEPDWEALVSYARALARQQTHDRTSQDDIVQMSMVRFLVYSRAERRIDRPFGLLKLIVPQVAANHFTRARHAESLDDIERERTLVGSGAPAPLPDAVVDVVNLLFELLEGAALVPIEVEVLTRVFVDQEPLEEIARELSTDLDVVAAALERAEAKVLQSLGLSPRQVQVVRLVHFRGLSNGEAAGVLDIEKNNVGVQLHSARAKLAKWLEHRREA